LRGKSGKGQASLWQQGLTDEKEVQYNESSKGGWEPVQIPRAEGGKGKPGDEGRWGE